MEITSANLQGYGFIGNIAPGWNVEESVSPRATGEYSNGTGSVSFNAKATSTTQLATNRETSTVVGDLGTITGTVKSASVSGIGASISHSTQLADYDFDGVIPPLSAGGVHSALDIVNQISGKPYLNTGLDADIDTYWSLGGHNAGFYFDDANDYKIRRGYSELVPYTYYSVSLGSWTTDYVTQSYDAIVGYNFAATGTPERIYAQAVSGDNFRKPGETLRFKGVGSFNFSFTAGPFDSNVDAGYTVIVSFNTSTHLLEITFRQYVGGVLTTTTNNTINSSISPTDVYYVEIVVNNSIINTTPSIIATIGKSILATSVVTMYPTLTGLPATYTGQWSIDGGYIRAVARKSHATTVSYNPIMYENTTSSAYYNLGASTLGGPVPSVKANAWTYLQDACSAYNGEIAISSDDYVTVRDIGSNSIDISNIAVAPSLSISSNYSGRSIDVTYTNGIEVVDGEVYAAYTLNDDLTVKENNILEVKSGEIVETTLQSSTSLSYVSGSIYKNLEEPTIGYYTVIDNTGIRLSETLWKDYGGSLTATINEDTPGAIDIKLHGPIIEIPAYPGPYKVAVSSGNEYAALSIIGSGIKTDVKTLNLQTGADPEIVKQDVAKSINNPFINTLEQAYDVGIWAAARAGEPTVTLSCSIPTNAISGLGLTAGSLFTYGNSQYRVTSASINSIGVNLTAERYLTVDEFDLLWSGKTVGQHDTVWEPYREQDQFIEPLRTV